MAIKLTKTIDGKEVVLDLISLNGKTCITEDYYKENVKPLGITKATLKKEAEVEVWKPKE